MIDKDEIVEAAKTVAQAIVLAIVIFGILGLL